MKIGFDNEKYLKMQSEHIRDLIQEVSLLKQRVDILEHENELLNEAALRRPDNRP